MPGALLVHPQRGSHETLDGIRHSNDSLRKERAPRDADAWLATVANNLSRNHLRRRRTRSLEQAPEGRTRAKTMSFVTQMSSRATPTRHRMMCDLADDAPAGSTPPPLGTVKTLSTLLALGLFAGSAPAQQRLPGAPPLDPLLRSLAPFSFAGYGSYELASSEPGDMELGDVNNDGHIDLVVAGRGGECTVMIGSGTGLFPNLETFWGVVQPYDPGPGGLALGDFDGDGKLDCAATLAASYDGLGQAVRRTNVFRGDGDGGFDYWSTVEGSGTFPIDATSADFDGDGLDDLAVVYNSARFDVFLSNGDGTFQPRKTLSGSTLSTTTGTNIEAVDFDADGTPDLVASFYRGHSIFWGDGTGQFDTTQATYAGPGTHFAVEDFNGDGHLDMATPVADHWPNYLGGLWVYAGDGGRGLDYLGRFGDAFPGSAACGAADINGDQVQDVLVITGVGMRPFLGWGDGSFRQEPDVPVAGTQLSSIVVADWNEDGLGDAGLSWRNYGETPGLSVMRNSTP